MPKYGYYPGCSLLSTGRPYNESVKKVFRQLDISLPELPDWNCCGATAYMNIDEAAAFALAARNLAIAERESIETIVTPCPACYLVLNKASDYLSRYPELSKKISRGLNAVGLKYEGKVQVRHPLDIIINDVELEKVKSSVRFHLNSLRVAPYYGCQMVRPYAKFDDPVYPTAMDRLLDALGAEVVPHPLKTRCCGGTLMETLPEIGLRLNQLLLKEIKRRRADVIATACPFCQFNLECYQDKISNTYSEDFHIPVVYFTQLMGLAFGLDPKSLGLWRNMQDLTPLVKLIVTKKEVEARA
jgi:heterodisulfide reductase subunit B